MFIFNQTGNDRITGHSNFSEKFEFVSSTLVIDENIRKTAGKGNKIESSIFLPVRSHAQNYLHVPFVTYAEFYSQKGLNRVSMINKKLTLLTACVYNLVLLGKNHTNNSDTSLFLHAYFYSLVLERPK